MPIRYPPRREPRVLAVTVIPTGLAFAVVNPWVVRGTGRTRCHRHTRRAAVLRLVRREKPTALTTTDASLVTELARVAKNCGIAVIKKRVPRLPVAIATDLFPELPLFAPGKLGRLAAMAISALLHVTPQSRQYATTRHNSPLRRPYRAVHCGARTLHARPLPVCHPRVFSRSHGAARAAKRSHRRLGQG